MYIDCKILMAFSYLYAQNYLQEKKKKDEVYQKRQKQVDSFVYENKINRGSTPRRTRPHSRDEAEVRVLLWFLTILLFKYLFA